MTDTVVPPAVVSAPKDMKYTSILSLDIEATGQTPRVQSYLSPDLSTFHGSHRVGSMNAIGICRIRVPIDEEPNDEHVMHQDRKEWCLDEISPAEPRCISEFWDKFPGLRAHFSKNAISVNQAMAEVAAYVKHIIEVDGDTVSWLCGPSSYDAMWFESYYVNFSPEGSIDLGHVARQRYICLSAMKRIAGDIVGRKEIDEKLSHPTTVKVSLSHNQAFKDASPTVFDSEPKATHFPGDDAVKQAFEYVCLKRILTNVRDVVVNQNQELKCHPPGPHPASPPTEGAKTDGDKMEVVTTSSL